MKTVSSLNLIKIYALNFEACVNSAVDVESSVEVHCGENLKFFYGI